MPTSDGQGKGVALGWYRQISPLSVMDIGVGEGTYAKLMRDAPDRVLTIGGEVLRRVHRDRWTAVEAWEPYVDQFGLRNLYDEVIVSDVRRLNWPIFRVDLVIAGDVLEHMPRDDAKQLLKRIRQGAANLIVSVPVLHLPQGAVNGNPYEQHVDHWTATAMRSELEQYGTVRDQWVGDVLAYFWWQREVT